MSSAGERSPANPQRAVVKRGYCRKSNVLETALPPKRFPAQVSRMTITDDQREALASMQRKINEPNTNHPVPVGLPPEIAGNAPKRYPHNRRCGKCGGMGTANPGERKCDCEQVACVLADGTVVYLTRGELNLIISARPVEVPGADPVWLDTGPAPSNAKP